MILRNNLGTGIEEMVRIGIHGEVHMIYTEKMNDENEYEYIYRIGSQKDQIGTWQDVADILNDELGYEYTESRYRKMYQAFQKMASGQSCVQQQSDPHDDILQKKYDMEKERVRLRDERGELNRIIRAQARADTLVEMIHDVILESVPPMRGYSPNVHQTSDNDLLVHLTDLHAGLKTKNFANAYDVDVMRDRLFAYADKICSVQMLHGSENCYLLLGGDLISGLIHSNLRLENNMNVIQQVMAVSSALCEFIAAIAPAFHNVYVYGVPGNHSRCLPLKEDNMKGENLDHLVFWYLEAAMREYRNVHCIPNDIEESVAIFRVRDHLVYGVHGDKDSVSSVVQSLTMFFKEKPDFVLMGHRHVNGLTTVYDTKVIESGCLSGPDNFCMDKRLRNQAEQMVAVINKDGLDCLYNVVLSE